jgi:hypothetical protein
VIGCVPIGVFAIFDNSAGLVVNEGFSNGKSSTFMEFWNLNHVAQVE